MMRSLQNFIIILTIATLASDGIASPVPENVKADSDADIDAADDPSYFDLCHPGLPCFKVSPDVFKAILEEQGINSVDDEEANDANDEDFDVGKRGSGSYLFRSRRGFNESPRLQPRSGMYLLRTRKSVFSPRSIRGNYLFRTRKSSGPMDRLSRGAGGNKYLFRTRKSDELMNRMSTRGKGYLFRTRK